MARFIYSSVFFLFWFCCIFLIFRFRLYIYKIFLFFFLFIQLHLIQLIYSAISRYFKSFSVFFEFTYILRFFFCFVSFHKLPFAISSSEIFSTLALILRQTNVISFRFEFPLNAVDEIISTKQK